MSPDQHATAPGLKQETTANPPPVPGVGDRETARHELTMPVRSQFRVKRPVGGERVPAGAKDMATALALAYPLTVIS